jgi:ribosomal protein S27AE
MRCGRCGEVLVEIRVRVGGTELAFRRCGRCDAQTWVTADGEIALDEVLELARQA